MHWWAAASLSSPAVISLSKTGAAASVFDGFHDPGWYTAAHKVVYMKVSKVYNAGVFMSSHKRGD
jgi:hypothetical protein